MLHAFIDESGQRGHTDNASPHFLLSAVVIRDRNLPFLGTVLEQLRGDLNRPAGTYLTWKNIRSHAERLQIAETIGGQFWLKTITVVACKLHLPPSDMTVDQMYMYQFRLLLERLSWLARQHQEVATYTLAHIRGFKLSTLRQYEAALRNIPTQIAWDHLDPNGGSIDQPQRDERLQLADLVASGTAPAFNPDRFGRTESRYLELLRPAIYQHSPSSELTSYGLKIHPWNASTRAAYPWIGNL